MQFLKALGWVWAIWLIVSAVAMLSRLPVAYAASRFLFGPRYRPLLENTRSGKQCIGKRFITVYGSLVLVDIALFWLCFQNFFPSDLRVPMIKPVFNLLIVLLGFASIMQTATIMMISSSVEAHLAEHDPDADSW